jgi:tRNA dimethylallyltransferase
VRACRGEVISADSRQIYRGMDIGTAKATPPSKPPRRTTCSTSATPTKCSLSPSISNSPTPPSTPFTRAATRRCSWAGRRSTSAPWWRDCASPRAARPGAARRAGGAIWRKQGVAALAQLQALDPATAAQIDARNPRRVLRALEIFLLTGQSKVASGGQRAAAVPHRC